MEKETKNTEKKDRRLFNLLLWAIVIVPWIVCLFTSEEAGKYYLVGASSTFLALWMYMMRENNQRGRWRKER